MYAFFPPAYGFLGCASLPEFTKVDGYLELSSSGTRLPCFSAGAGGSPPGVNVACTVSGSSCTALPDAALSPSSWLVPLDLGPFTLMLAIIIERKRTSNETNCIDEDVLLFLYLLKGARNHWKGSTKELWCVIVKEGQGLIGLRGGCGGAGRCGPVCIRPLGVCRNASILGSA